MSMLQDLRNDIILIISHGDTETQRNAHTSKPSDTLRASVPLCETLIKALNEMNMSEIDKLIAEMGETPLAEKLSELVLVGDYGEAVKLIPESVCIILLILYPAKK
jgi:hypothetical protein